VDGQFSLFVNFVILLSATQVLSLFLNFAALQFIQTIDIIAPWHWPPRGSSQKASSERLVM
jgi:hypothetical protein